MCAVRCACEYAGLLLPVDTVRVCREGEVWDGSVDQDVSFDNRALGDGQSLGQRLGVKLAAMVTAEIHLRSTPLVDVSDGIASSC
jgi:hypothetical protein